MKAFLFGWNPIKFKWADIQSDIDRLRNGGEVIDDWSVVSYKTIQPGDRAYMVRVGAEPRGIFASAISSLSLTWLLTVEGVTTALK